LLPESEQHVIKHLNTIQRKAIFNIRKQATQVHNEAVVRLVARCQKLGVDQQQLWSALSWIRDLAPIIVHLDLDKVGPFLGKDTHYRNQFETSTSMGCDIPHIRNLWEQRLFDGIYPDDCEPFLRPKYGVLDVMNDFRGVMSARMYGDSYLVLKNTRLRCTFCSEDSCTAQLKAVLDQYAHIFDEYSDTELKEVVRVANAPRGSKERIGDSTVIEEEHYKEAQIHGEIDLKKHVKRLVVHPKHRVDGLDEKTIRQICRTNGWDFIWMDDEMRRRIHEERMTQDSGFLEMNWLSDEVTNLPGLQGNDHAAVE
jgi:hypothetical protein